MIFKIMKIQNLHSLQANFWHDFFRQDISTSVAFKDNIFALLLRRSLVAENKQLSRKCFPCGQEEATFEKVTANQRIITIISGRRTLNFCLYIY